MVGPQAGGTGSPAGREVGLPAADALGSHVAARDRVVEAGTDTAERHRIVGVRLEVFVSGMEPGRSRTAAEVDKEAFLCLIRREVNSKALL